MTLHGRRVFTQSGWIVNHPNKHDPSYLAYGSDATPEFKGRVPILAHPTSRRVWVGGPGWYHFDVMDNHTLPGDESDYERGYFGGGPQWGNGNLRWYGMDPFSEHKDVANALTQAGYTIPNPNGENSVDDLSEGLGNLNWNAY